MNDVLRIDTIASSPADSTLTKEDQAKNDIFGIVTLILNLLALLFILYTVAPEYRFVKRLIATIRMVCFLLARGAAALLTHTLSQSRIVSKTSLGFTLRRKSLIGVPETEMNALNNVSAAAAP